MWKPPIHRYKFDSDVNRLWISHCMKFQLRRFFWTTRKCVDLFLNRRRRTPTVWWTSKPRIQVQTRIQTSELVGHEAKSAICEKLLGFTWQQVCPWSAEKRFFSFANMWLENRLRYLNLEKRFRKCTILFAGNVPKIVLKECFRLMYVLMTSKDKKIDLALSEET